MRVESIKTSRSDVPEMMEMNLRRLRACCMAAHQREYLDRGLDILMGIREYLSRHNFLGKVYSRLRKLSKYRGLCCFPLVGQFFFSIKILFNDDSPQLVEWFCKFFAIENECLRFPFDRDSEERMYFLLANLLILPNKRMRDQKFPVLGAGRA